MPSAPQRRVVIVDDVATITTVVKIFLQGLDLEFTTVTDSIKALSAVRALKPALLIADVQMPGKDGLELCSDIRSDPELSGTRVILFSAHAGEETVQRRARLLGADRLLLKPIAPEDMRRAVMEVLHK